MSFSTINIGNAYGAPDGMFAAISEGASGTTAVPFTVTRSGGLSSTVGVSWAVTGASTDPADAGDFVGGVLPSGTLFLAPGQASAVITVNVAGDTTYEPYEIFSITLSNPVGGASLGKASGQGLIRNDDQTMSISALLADKAEGGDGQTLYTFLVDRQSDNSGGFNSEWVVTGSGANPATADDFVGGAFPTGSVGFRSGQPAMTITVAVAGDRRTEGDEGFTVTLRNPSTSVTYLSASASGVIRNDDALVSIEAGPVSFAEGQSGNALHGFALTRTGNLSAAQQVGWTVAGAGTDAADAADFAGGALPSGTVSFAAGQASASIAVAVAGDGQMEADEGFAVTLSPPADGAELGNRVAAGVIRNDEASLAVAALDADRSEGQSGPTPFTFTVTRGGDLSVSHGARWTVTGAGAEGTDFVGGVLPSGEVVFAAGEAQRTVTVNVSGDRTVEADEGFAFSLFAPTGGATLGVSTAQGVIRGDDAVAEPVRGEVAVTGGAGVDAARIEGGLRGSAVTAEGGLPSRVTVGEDGPGYALSGVEVLDFADGRLVFDPSDPAAQVVRLFEAALDRAPDQAGLNFYVAALRGGQSLADIARGFVASPEFGARFGTGLSDDAYVGRLYANVLGRAASDAELAFYREGLNAGLTREQVLVGFSESPENKALTAPLVGAGIWDLSETAALTARLYDTMFGRLPDLAGLRFHRDGLDAGTATPLGLVGNFLGSPEFNARYGAGTGNRELVELLYGNTLDRAASAPEVDYYVSRLEGGALSRAQLVLDFSESPEHQALLAPVIGAEDPSQFGILFA